MLQSLRNISPANARGTWPKISVAFAIGLLSGWLLPAVSVGVGSALTYGNVLQAIATLGSALIVGWWLSNRTAMERNERALIIKQLDLQSDHLSDLAERVAEGGYARISNCIKKLNITNSAARTMCHKCTYLESEKLLDSLAKQIGELKVLCTETNLADASGIASAEVNGGVITYSAPRELAIGTNIATIRNRIFEAQVCLNRE